MATINFPSVFFHFNLMGHSQEIVMAFLWLYHIVHKFDEKTKGQKSRDTFPLRVLEHVTTG
jgi:hypothetical protein